MLLRSHSHHPSLCCCPSSPSSEGPKEQQMVRNKAGKFTSSEVVGTEELLYCRAARDLQLGGAPGLHKHFNHWGLLLMEGMLQRSMGRHVIEPVSLTPLFPTHGCQAELPTPASSSRAALCSVSAQILSAKPRATAAARISLGEQLRRINIEAEKPCADKYIRFISKLTALCKCTSAFLPVSYGILFQEAACWVNTATSLEDALRTQKEFGRKKALKIQ